MAYDLRNTDALQTLQVLPPGSQISPTIPTKRIHDGEDLSFFLHSQAYADIITFVLQLNRAMVPEKDSAGITHAWPLDGSEIILSENVTKIALLVRSLKALMDCAPPETGPRRFGNAAFRTWYAAAQESALGLLREALSGAVWGHAAGQTEREVLEKEIESYLLGSFGSPERLDYGTGHELSFLAFLGCVWKLGGFAQAAPGVEERGIVLGVIQPYLELVRTLILTYTLEPAGSHGVWGLDDHSFLPYILGSAQYCPPIHPGSTLPTEGALSGSPLPSMIAKRESVELYRPTNLYFSAIGFIFDVKSGPFWEHSPTLYDISGINDGWAKINKGMIKMFNAEVLSKFPVVQHFPFGTLFGWNADPRAVAQTTSPHVSAQPQRTAIPASGATQPMAQTSRSVNGPTAHPSLSGTAAPWAKPSAMAPRTTMPALGGQQGRINVAPSRGPTMPSTMPPRYAAAAARHQQMQPPTQLHKENTQ